MRALVGDEMDLGSLRLLASAVARRPMEVAVATSGDQSWTDGKTVFLEGTVHPANQIRMLAVQGSLVASGSLDPDILRQLVRRPELTRRYLAVEGHRALLANEHVLPPWVCSLIDRELASSSRSVEESLDWARARHPIGEAPLVFGTIDVRRSLASMHPRTEIHLGRPPDARPGGKDRALTDLDSDEDDRGASADLLLSPVGGGGPVGRLLQKMFRPGRRGTGGGPVGADSPTHSTSARPASRGYASAAKSSMGEREISPEGGYASTSTVYPEWDGGRRRYRPEWCTVIESDAPAEVTATMQLPTGLAVRRSLASLGTGMIRCRRQPQGDDIDIDAALEAHIDALAGRPHGDDGYVASRRWRRDLGVLVLLDVSGSAGEPGVTGRSVHEQQRLAAVTLTAALHDLGDRVAMYAFNSRGRQAVQVLRVKAFDDHLDVQVTRRLAGLEPAAYTRLGAAIRHGSSILEWRSGTPRRLLVVLSDGLAYDHGYQGGYGEADAHRALTESRYRGVGCVCLSVGTDAQPDSLRRVFGSAAHAVMPTPDGLPAVIAPLFRAALRSAEGQRRAFQRQQRTRERFEIEMEK